MAGRQERLARRDAEDRSRGPRRVVGEPRVSRPDRSRSLRRLGESGGELMPVLGSTEQRDLLWRRSQERRDDAGEPDPERVLLSYLRHGYVEGVPLQLNGKGASATGRVLRDAVVSRLEVCNALALLPDPERRCVEAWFIDGRSRRTA